MNSYKTPWDIMIAAQSGDPDAMYMMGIFCSQRLQFEARPGGVMDDGTADLVGSEELTNELEDLSMLGPAGSKGAPRTPTTPEVDLVSAFGDMTLAHSRALPESESRACYWFRRAAEVGHIASMPSLAHRLKKGTGTPMDHRSSRDWCARAMDLGCKISHDTFRDDSLLTKEAVANIFYLMESNIAKKAPVSPKIPILQPHLHGLLMAIGGKKYREEKYASLYYRKHCLDLDRLLTELKTPNPLQLEFIACRSGTIKDHTDAAFPKPPPSQYTDSLTYRPNSFRGYSELVHQDEILTRRWRNAMPPYLMLCPHISDYKPISSCALCVLDAKHRLLAISFGQYAMSTKETHPGTTYDAVWVNLANGKMRREKFKGYCRKEVEFVLRELKGFGWGYLHPYHLAMDPNLLWPIIYYWGSVRACIEVLAPEVRWDLELGGVGIVRREDVEKIVAGGGGKEVFLFGVEHEGRSFVRCAAGGCGRLEVDKKFALCGKCKRKRYCGRECQVGDWGVHKRECASLAAAQ
ncbi:hypothetical protein HK097_002586 [Rhizophlyctis rosea]|uniref:MYND-type domain-containing protein n=1 Tax=Rhizophlyctis rosea TaxID=64517 RepID=A0AAD5S397_9FUNG|nr:hypothetical protein HK097_002586 [Rhizophlyctis rosea]